jgi:RHS repeat-associated protein
MLLTNVSSLGVGFGFQLIHRSQGSYSGPLGPNWRHSFEAELDITGSLVTFTNGSGQTTEFIPDGSGGWEIDDTTSFFQSFTLTNPSGTVWEITTRPDGFIWRFEETAITSYPDTAGRLVEIEDQHGNKTTMTYTSGVLSSIDDPQSRQILLTYTSGVITGVEDPRGQTHTLSYDSEDNITSVSGPGGCTVSFGYRDPTNHLITSVSDALGSTTFYEYTDTDNQIASVAFPGGGKMRYSYLSGTEGPLEYLGNGSHETRYMNSTTVTHPDGAVFEYRFEDNGRLWRVVMPSGHIKRYFWSPQQHFLYCSEGFPLFKTGNTYGPYDNIRNRVTARTVNTEGDVLQSIDSNGIISTFDYDSEGHLLSSHPGQANQGVQGNWPEYYGEDGVILCAFNEDDSDVYEAPSYLNSSLGTAITNGDGSGGDLFTRANHNAVDLLDGRAPIKGDGSTTQGIGHWTHTSAAEVFQFAINLTQTQSFNLSIYTHSADHEKDSLDPLRYNEIYGRDIEVEVEDLDGTQTYHCFNNAPGIWMTFPVKGDSSNPVKITVTAEGDNDQPVISALAFDPHEDRRRFYEYDSNGKRTKVTDGLGNETAYTYNTDGAMATMTDARSKTTTYQYLDTNKNLTKITDHDSNVTTRTFDDNGNMLTSTDANSHVTTMTYDGKNRLLTTTDPLSNVTEFDYDGNGNVLSITDAELRETLFTYVNNKVSTIEDPLGNTVSFIYDVCGRLASQTDARGFTTRYFYDLDGCLSRIESPDGQNTTFSYDSVNRLVALTSPNGNQDSLDLVNLVGAANFFRNPDFEVEDPNRDGPSDWFRSSGSEDLETVETYQGGASLPISASIWSQSDIDVPAGAKLLATGQYKPNAYLLIERGVRGLQGTVDDADESFANFETGQWNQLSHSFEIPGDSQTSQGNPAISNFSAKWVDNGYEGWLDELKLFMLSTAYLRNTEGQIKAVTTPDGAQTRIHRDQFNRVTSSEDAKGERTRMFYDALDRVTSISKPNGDTLSFTYNEVGALASFVDERNKTTSFTYDNLNRLTTITYPDSTTEVFAYDDVSNLTSYTDNKSQAKTFSYDDADRLETITYPDTSTVEFDYDGVGNLTSLTERNGDSIAYTYDDGDRLTSVVRTKDIGNSTPEWSHSYTYDESGNRTELESSSVEIWSSGSPNVAKHDQSVYGIEQYSGGRDPMNRLLGVRAWETADTSFEYGPEGRRNLVSHSNGVQTNVDFDIVGRPLGMTTSSPSGRLLSVDYGYDVNSNRIKQVTGQDTFDYKLDENARLVAESVNRLVEAGVQDFVQGEFEDIVLTSNGLTCLPNDDDFSGDELNCDRWRITYANASSSTHPDTFPGLEVRQDEGLHMVFPRGYSARSHQIDGLHNITENYGLQSEDLYIFAEHRVQLVGNFDVRVDLVDHQGFGGTEAEAMLYISEDPSEQFDDADYMQFGLNHSGEILVKASTGTESTATAPSEPVTLRLTRNGSTVTAYYWDSGTTSWITQTGWDRTLNDGPMWVGLASRAYYQAYVSASFENFLHDGTEIVEYVTTGQYTSRVYDPGRHVDWKSLAIQATTPTNTEAKLQIAVSDSEQGPWSYIGPDGTSSTYFTASSTNLMGQSYIGRYARYRAYLSGNGTVTPTLSQVEFGFSGSLTSQYRSFEFDAAGNMTSKIVADDSETVEETRTYNDLNEITQNVIDDGTTTTTWTFTSDDNGNMTSKTDGTDTYTYTWTVDNQLEEVELNSSTVVSYSYDSGSRMIQRVEGTTTTNYTWDGWDLVREDKSGGVTETTEYLVPEGEVLAFKRAGSTYRFHGDGLSSTQLVTDEDGEQVARFVYGAWGEELYASDSVTGGVNVRFVGGLGVRNDAAAGLIYMRHRWYDSQLGRFISRDPIGFRGGNNFYEYADGNPATRYDPQGLNPVTAPPPAATAPQPFNPGGSASSSSSSSGSSSPMPRPPMISPNPAVLVLGLTQSVDDECPPPEGSCKEQFQHDESFCNNCLDKSRDIDLCLANARRSYESCLGGGPPNRLLPPRRKIRKGRRFITAPGEGSVDCNAYIGRPMY